MKRRLFIILSSVSFVVLCFGVNNSIFPESANSRPEAIKTWEYGHDRSGELNSAFLDDLAGRLREDPTTTAAIIAYGPEGDKSGSGKFLLENFHAYMEHRAGKDRIAYIYGGQAESVTTVGIELWIVPRGAKLPKPTKHFANLESFVGEIGVSYVTTLLGDIDFDPEGPTAGFVSMAAFAQILHHQPEAVGYIASYQEQDAGPLAWQRYAERTLRILNDYGISSDRVKVIPAGIDQRGHTQFWVQPPDMLPPIRDVGADLDRLPKEAFQIDAYNKYQTLDDDEQGFELKGITDLLNKFPTAKVCYVYRPAIEEPDGKNEKKEDKEDDSSEVDLNELVLKWRTELIATSNIDPDRIIILFAPPEESTESLEAWIVPSGATLPDLVRKDDDPDDDNRPEKPATNKIFVRFTPPSVR